MVLRSFIRRQLTSPGHQADCKQAEALMAGLQPLPAVGDKGYHSDKEREHWRARDIGTCHLPKRNRIVRHWHDTELHCTRHLVETLSNFL